MVRSLSIFAMVLAGLAHLPARAQERLRPPTKVELLELLQNDLSGAMARATLPYEEREKLAHVSVLLGENIARQRETRKLDEHAVRSAMKVIENASKQNLFAVSDRMHLDNDREQLRDLLEHRPPARMAYARAGVWGWRRAY